MEEEGVFVPGNDGCRKAKYNAEMEGVSAGYGTQTKQKKWMSCEGTTKEIAERKMVWHYRRMSRR